MTLKQEEIDILMKQAVDYQVLADNTLNEGGQHTGWIDSYSLASIAASLVIIANAMNKQGE